MFFVGQRISVAKGTGFHGVVKRCEANRKLVKGCFAFFAYPNTCGNGTEDNKFWRGWKRIAFSAKIIRVPFPFSGSTRWV